jgi:hypothetical protein
LKKNVGSAFALAAVMTKCSKSFAAATIGGFLGLIGAFPLCCAAQWLVKSCGVHQMAATICLVSLFAVKWPRFAGKGGE